MKNQKIAMLIQQAKESQEMLHILLVKFQPLVNAYCKKLFFLDTDDAKQELYLAIIECVKNMPHCNTDGQCINYVTNAIRFKYCYLCKKNLSREKIEDSYAEFVEKEYVEEFGLVELRCDLNKSLTKLTGNKKKIMECVLLGHSDIEIAKEMNISSQYINRIRKQIQNRYLESYM